MYFNLVLTIHLALCVVLICLVLLQQGKGADVGATFGGGSNTLFGAGGAVSLITKVTTSVAIAFMVTSILLVRAYGERGHVGPERAATVPLAGSVMEGVAVKKEEAKADAVKVVPGAPAPAAKVGASAGGEPKGVEATAGAPAAAPAPEVKVIPENTDTANSANAPKAVTETVPVNPSKGTAKAKAK